MIKINWSGIWESAKNNKGKITIFVLLGILVLGVMFFTDRCGSWGVERFKNKKTQEIANNVAEIKKIDGEIDAHKEAIAGLEGNKAAKKEQIAEDTKDLTNTLIMREEDKIAVNQAWANYNKALASNSNTNATAEDLEKQLRRLEQQ